MAGKKKIDGASDNGNWGGKRPNQTGRPSEGERLNIRKMLDESIDPSFVTDKLFQLIDNGDFRAIDLWHKYRVGTPVQSIDMNVTGSTDINFNLSDVIKFKDEE